MKKSGAFQNHNSFFQIWQKIRILFKQYIFQINEIAETLWAEYMKQENM